MKKTVCLMIAALMCLAGFAGVSAGIAEGTEPGQYMAAFSAWGHLNLVHVDPMKQVPEAPDSGSDREIGAMSFMGLTPDGKTILFGGFEKKTEVVELQPDETPESTSETESLVRVTISGRGNKKRKNDQTRTIITRIPYIGVIRDGEVIEFRANAERGDGDPYEALNDIMNFYQGIPGREGLSWSADGRYVTFSSTVLSVQASEVMNVPVIDTVTGEYWLAKSFMRNYLIEGGGQVYISRMSRNGEYVYYVAYEVHDGSSGLCFCRCTPEGGRQEILYADTGYDWEFDVLRTSELYEMTDGSWVMSGISGSRRNNGSHAFIHFAPMGDTWTARVYPLLIGQWMAPGRFACSDVSGYGIMTLYNQTNNNAAYRAEMEGTASDYSASMIWKRLNLMRILPGDDFAYDTWYLRRTAENYTDLEMVSASEYLQFAQDIYQGNTPEAPAGFNAADVLRYPDPWIVNACLSPDGRYALLVVNTGEWNEQIRGMIYRLYLLDLETMNVKPVQAPESAISENLAADAMPGKNYAPKISWNPDGTIILINGENRIEFFRLSMW